ncbi:unnamed protein product [Musa banksii]
MADENPSDVKEEVSELAPFDPTKKKKKKKVVLQDSAEVVDKLAEKTENLTVADSGEPSFAGMKKKKKKQVDTNFLNDENGDVVDDLTGDQVGGEDEGEGIVLGVGRYPWEGTDRDYKYEELLGRVFNILREHNPDLAGDRRRTVMRPPQVLREGTKKTVFVNFMDLCKTMHRQHEHVMNFLLAEMGTNGSLDGQQRLVVKGRFAPKNFEGILRRYMSMSYAMAAKVRIRYFQRKIVCSFFAVNSAALHDQLHPSRLVLLHWLAAEKLAPDFHLPSVAAALQRFTQTARRLQSGLRILWERILMSSKPRAICSRNSSNKLTVETSFVLCQFVFAFCSISFRYC